MLTFPQFDPVALSISPITIHWYGVMYMIAFGGAYRAKQQPDEWSAEQISEPKKRDEILVYCQAQEDLAC